MESTSDMKNLEWVRWLQRHANLLPRDVQVEGSNRRASMIHFATNGNVDKRPVGKCGLCGGVVSITTISMSVNRPVPTCEKCGAVADEAANLPTVTMRGQLPSGEIRKVIR